MDRWSTEPMGADQALASPGGTDTDVLPRDARPDAGTDDRLTTTVGSLAGLRAMRRRLAEWLDQLGVDPPLFVADVQLVAVEIVTNAFVHSAASTVDVSLEIVDDDVVATIEHSSAIPTPIDGSTTLPGSSSVTGRGLVVVDQIARARTVSHAGARSTIRLDIPLPAAG